MDGDESFVSHRKLLKNMNCLNCYTQFSTRDFNPKGSRYPMLLQCGHSVCETCLQNSIKASKSVTCKECNFVSSSEPKENCTECFPLSIHALGKLIAFQTYKGRDKKTQIFPENCADFDYSVVGHSCSSQSLAEVICCEECSFTACWHCENCTSNFCEVCWVKVHGSAKSLKKHRKTALKTSDFGRIGLKKCPQHENQNLEFFCKGCSTLVCAHCVVLQHQGDGHSPMTLKEKNLEILNKVEASAREAKEVWKSIKKSKEKVKELQDVCTQFSALQVAEEEAKISKKFSLLHGILQLEEERCLKKVHEAAFTQSKRLKDAYEELEKDNGALDSLLREYKEAVEQPQRSDLMGLQKQLEEVKKMPCLLVVESPRPAEVEVRFDEKAIGMIESFCSVELTSELVFEVRPREDFSECQSEETQSGLEAEWSEGRELEDSAIGDMCCSEEADREREESEGSLLPSKRLSSPKVFCERKSYSVRVSYIKNPGEFYVTLHSQRSKQQGIQKRAHQVATTSLAVPAAANKDDLLLVKYNVDKKWYRGRVIGAPCRGAKGEESALIYYLDYGNCEVVPLSRCRAMPKDMEEESPLAVKCRLSECVPKGETWCEESAKTMEKILNNYTATMYVMKVKPDCLEVDLSVIYPEGQIGRDLVSVRDTLVLLDLAKFVNGSKGSQNASSFKYMRQCLPISSDAFECTITHVNSPSDFYIQALWQGSLRAVKLSLELNEYYEANFYKGMIYNPVVGMPCVAMFSMDQKWYRAKIVDVPGKKMVTVFYVDYGNKETLPWTSVRKLKEMFIELPPLALNCELAGIPGSVDWSAEAKSYLEKYILAEDCRVEIQSQSKQHLKLKVILYVRGKNKEIVMNELLLEMNNKTRFNGSSTFCGMSKAVEDPPAEPKEQFEVRRKPKLSAQKLKELHECKKKMSREKAGKVETKDDADLSGNFCKVRIDVILAESPSSLYVGISAFMKDYEDLQKELLNFYKSSEPDSGKDWSVGSACAVYSSERCSWHRASVLSVLPNNQVQVFLRDSAEVLTEPVTALRELNPKFMVYPTFAIKCHLADIGPPGQDWPSVSSEFLQSEINFSPDLFMTKKGDMEDQSLPIELWVKKIIPGGALEPTEKVWITLNNALVDQGLAVPLKLKTMCSGVPARECPGEALELKEVPSNAESDSSFNEWLPPEPLEHLSFIGVPTYVDANANLYILDLSKDKERLEHLFSSLLEEFQDSDPEDCVWTSGQLCVVRYHVDGCWYRGKILKVNDNSTYEVLFVDYGNIETCENVDLRSKLIMQHLPILSHKFRLQNIEPLSSDGVWPTALMDMLHCLVVEKKCEVTVLEVSADTKEASEITLKLLEEDIELGKFFVEQGLAVKGGSEASDEAAPERESLRRAEPQVDCNGPRYLPLKVPEECTGFCIEVTAVTSSEEFFANVVDAPDLPPSLKIVLRQFKCLEEQLMVEGPSQPLADSLLAGEPFCSLCPWNNEEWGRGEIHGTGNEENLISVFYVDYGRKENVAGNLLHKCKAEWLNLPKMGLKFKLANVKRRFTVPYSIYEEALSKCLTKANLPFAKIIRNEEVLEVELQTHCGGSLIYQEMIDNNLMMFSWLAIKKC